MSIPSITRIENQKRIAILDTSSVSFLQVLNQKNDFVDKVLQDYDLILIPGWVWEEISDSKIRIAYVEKLIGKGYPIFEIVEEKYSSFVDEQEWNLYQIVKAATNKLGHLKSYLRKNVEAKDPLDMEEYAQWIKRLYNEWPIDGDVLSSGRWKKKNAGEISITILAEMISWYYLNSEIITIYSQDSDSREFQTSAEDELRQVFKLKVPVPISYKSNDAILCQLYRNGIISEDGIRDARINERKITYIKVMDDKSLALVTELLDTDDFINLVNDLSIQIVF